MKTWQKLLMICLVIGLGIGAVIGVKMIAKKKVSDLQQVNATPTPRNIPLALLTIEESKFTKSNYILSLENDVVDWKKAKRWQIRGKIISYDGDVMEMEVAGKEVRIAMRDKAKVLCSPATVTDNSGKKLSYLEMGVFYNKIDTWKDVNKEVIKTSFGEAVSADAIVTRDIADNLLLEGIAGYGCKL